MVQLSETFFQHTHHELGFLVATRLGLLGITREGFFDRCHVRQCEFGVDDFDVVHRINLARDVNHVVVCEAAHHMHNRIRLANVGEELVAEALALARPGNEPRDVDELNTGVLDFLRLDDLCQIIEA